MNMFFSGNYPYSSIANKEDSTPTQSRHNANDLAPDELGPRDLPAAQVNTSVR